MITTLSEFETYLKSNTFQGHTGVRFAGVLYGVLMRLEGNGVSSQTLDDLLSDAGFKTRGHYSRYLQYGFKYCEDIYAFERLLGLDRKADSGIPKDRVKPAAHVNRRRKKGLGEIPVQNIKPVQVADAGENRNGGNDLLLRGPQFRRNETDERQAEDVYPDHDFSSVPEYPEDQDIMDEADMAERLLPLGRKEPPARKTQKTVVLGGSGKSFTLRRAKTEDELKRERTERREPVNSIENTEDNYESSAIAESRRAGIPASARRGKVETDE